jgi:hypothetical protein
MPSERKRGLYEKFRVERTDGKSAPGEKHDGCHYFVLDLDHDEFAGAALKAYAEACKDQYPALSVELRHIGVMGNIDRSLGRKAFDQAIQHDRVEQEIHRRFAGGDDAE